MSEVLKQHRNPNYIAISTYHLMDKSLSLKAKGLLTILLTLPDNWNYSVETLTELSNDGRTAVRTTLQELEKHNYLVRKKIYVKNQIAGTEYHVFETPKSSQSQETTLRSGFLTLENLTSGNVQLSINTNNISSNKDLNTIKNIKEDIKDNKVYTGIRRKKELFQSTDVTEEIIKYYQTNCVDLKQLRVVTEDRKKAVKDILKKYGPDTVKEVLDKAQSSSFLKGETGTWKCGFDWIFKEKNFVKILEGNYDKDFTAKKKRKYDTNVSTDTYTEEEMEEVKKYHEKLRKEGRRVEY